MHRQTERARKTLNLLREVLDVPEDLEVIVGDFQFNGVYHNDQKLIQLSTCDITVLAHEMVHAEQYHTGRLQDMWDSKTQSWLSVWEGNIIQDAQPDTNYEEYLKLPWEVEAFDRQGDLVEYLKYKNA